MATNPRPILEPPSGGPVAANLKSEFLSYIQEGQLGKELQFGPYQVNAPLLQDANPNHFILHCLPAYRGKEITEDVLEHHADTIFQQAENRLHIQKGIMSLMAKDREL